MSGPAEGRSAATDVAVPRDAFVTGTIADQLFGIPIGRARDVFTVTAITPVPLAPPDILGFMNLRGRVVTALDIRHRLGLPPAAVVSGAMAIGIEAAGEPFGILVDRIGEIVTVDRDDIQPNPVHLDPAWAGLSRGVYGLDGEILVLLDVDAILETASLPQDSPHASESLQ